MASSTPVLLRTDSMPDAKTILEHQQALIERVSAGLKTLLEG